MLAVQHFLDIAASLVIGANPGMPIKEAIPAAHERVLLLDEELGDGFADVITFFPPRQLQRRYSKMHVDFFTPPGSLHAEHYAVISPDDAELFCNTPWSKHSRTKAATLRATWAFLTSRKVVVFIVDLGGHHIAVAARWGSDCVRLTTYDPLQSDKYAADLNRICANLAQVLRGLFGDASTRFERATFRRFQQPDNHDSQLYCLLFADVMAIEALDGPLARHSLLADEHAFPLARRVDFFGAEDDDPMRELLAHGPSMSKAEFDKMCQDPGTQHTIRRFHVLGCYLVR
ncbi:hypothetical protein H9P43_004445 [Blastocladiella emersonii ATCC 22665]|nr:hypothetical protein H9P43_004445 [Blastocladiella emersonii ATCC 22665]